MKKKRARKMFDNALEWVGEDEVANFRPHSLGDLTVQDFLAEYCWAVFATNFSYKVLRSKFPHIREAFGGFEPDYLTKMELDVAKLPIRNAVKATGFLRGACYVISRDFNAYKAELRRRTTADGDASALTELPGIGPVNKDHLAKNVGLEDVAKPDRWLVRCACECNCTVSKLVAYLADEYKLEKHRVDTVLWWYCAKYQEVP